MKFLVRFIGIVVLITLDYFIITNIGFPLPTNILLLIVAFNVFFLWGIAAAKTKQEMIAHGPGRVRFWVVIPGLFIIGCAWFALLAGTSYSCAFSMSDSCGELEFLYITGVAVVAAIVVILLSIRWKK